MNADVSAIIAFLLEDDPVRRERAAYVARMRDKMKLPFRRIGRQLNVTPQRAHQLYLIHKALAAPVAESDETDDINPKEFATASSPEGAIQRISEWMNGKGLTGEFKLWPKGTYRGPYPEYAQNADFSMTLSGILADEWEENFNLQDEFQLLAKSLGYHAEAGTRSSIHFYLDVPWDDEDAEPLPEPKELPPVNLRDIQF